MTTCTHDNQEVLDDRWFIGHNYLRVSICTDCPVTFVEHGYPLRRDELIVSEIPHDDCVDAICNVSKA